MDYAHLIKALALGIAAFLAIIALALVLAPRFPTGEPRGLPEEPEPVILALVVGLLVALGVWL
jgi:hypothetical protein